MDTTTFRTILDKLDSEFIFVLLLLGGIMTAVTLMVIVTTSMKYWHSYRESKMASDMIRDMLERQMTPENIVAVMGTWKGSAQDIDQVKQTLGAQAGVPPKPLKPQVQMGA